MISHLQNKPTKSHLNEITDWRAVKKEKSFGMMQTRNILVLSAILLLITAKINGGIHEYNEKDNLQIGDFHLISSKQIMRACKYTNSSIDVDIYNFTMKCQ